MLCDGPSPSLELRRADMSSALDWALSILPAEGMPLSALPHPPSFLPPNAMPTSQQQASQTLQVPLPPDAPHHMGGYPRSADTEGPIPQPVQGCVCHPQQW